MLLNETVAAEEFFFSTIDMTFMSMNKTVSEHIILVSRKNLYERKCACERMTTPKMN